MSPRVVVVGGGLAGIAAALECADRGGQVTLLERRQRLGGLTWSFRHADRWVDNGQHVFLRCCDQYLAFLDRIGASGEVELQGRLDIPVVAPGSRPVVGRLRRSSLPAPFHLAGSLLGYPHLGVRGRVGLGRAVLGLMRLDLGDPRLDNETFGGWLQRRGQSPESIAALWDLITVPTVNLPASQASLAMGAKVFKTGLLEDPAAADIGWSRVPLGQLHGERAAAALAKSGVEIRLGVRVESVASLGCGWEVVFDGGTVQGDAVIVAVPHDVAGSVLPPGAVGNQERLADLGSSAVVDVHLVFDRKVTSWPLMAGVNSPVQWVFDRTASSGLDHGQYLAVSMSAADELLGRHPDELVAWITAELARLLPSVATATVVDSLVTKERTATFRAVPGSGDLRPPAKTRFAGLAVAGAWTDTGWPATMEGATRSGRAAATAVFGTATVPPQGSSNQLQHLEVA